MSHPLHSFQYCPRCGSPGFAINDVKSKRCPSCGFVYYFNSSASTAAFITDSDGRLLVAKRAKEPAKGTLDLPGGFVDLHETAEEAIAREIKEETGLNAVGLRYLFSLPNVYPYSGFEVHTVDLFFQCSIECCDRMQAADDVAELMFIQKEKIKPEHFGLTSIRRAIEIWLKQS